MKPLTFGSLFAGIGGLDLGLERAGMECVWQVEIDPFCRKVLAKHWPHVRRFGDVRECGRHNLETVDLVCGGFPCQDISKAANWRKYERQGIAGKRSGLWGEFSRILYELRPRYVLVENVTDILYRGIDTVLGDLAAFGYDAEWECVSAAAVGANHVRNRTFIVAYPRSLRRGAQPVGVFSELRGKRLFEYHAFDRRANESREVFADAGAEWWEIEPDVGRVAHGVPYRVDRLRALGNAVVPQVAEWIGKRIMEAERGQV